MSNRTGGLRSTNAWATYSPVAHWTVGPWGFLKMNPREPTVFPIKADCFNDSFILKIPEIALDLGESMKYKSRRTTRFWVRRSTTNLTPCVSLQSSRGPLFRFPEKKGGGAQKWWMGPQVMACLLENLRFWHGLTMFSIAMEHHHVQSSNRDIGTGHLPSAMLNWG